LTAVEPKHKMYLNLNSAAFAAASVDVEPKHKMYLN